MFTGLIEAIGILALRESRPGGVKLRIRAPSIASELKLGASSLMPSGV